MQGPSTSPGCGSISATAGSRLQTLRTTVRRKRRGSWSATSSSPSTESRRRPSPLRTRVSDSGCAPREPSCASTSYGRECQSRSRSHYAVGFDLHSNSVFDEIKVRSYVVYQEYLIRGAETSVDREKMTGDVV